MLRGFSAELFSQVLRLTSDQAALHDIDSYRGRVESCARCIKTKRNVDLSRGRRSTG